LDSGGLRTASPPEGSCVFVEHGLSGRACASAAAPGAGMPSGCKVEPRGEGGGTEIPAWGPVLASMVARLGEGMGDKREWTSKTRDTERCEAQCVCEGNCMVPPRLPYIRRPPLPRTRRPSSCTPRPSGSPTPAAVPQWRLMPLTRNGCTPTTQRSPLNPTPPA